MDKKIEAYIAELPAELQEKARQCKDMRELSEFVAENDIELSEDALEMVAGGCGTSEPKQGDLVDKNCPNCGKQLRFHQKLSNYRELYCDNKSCVRYYIVSEKSRRVFADYGDHMETCSLSWT
ncbi:MAG: hypothetical protein IIZ62_07200 [Ruminococcus sp.]|nr:hypothetical protein [Ruminococcus sp.]